MAPTVTVVGSGAMGSLVGGLLAEHGWPVTLYDVWEEHVRTMNADGLLVRQPDGSERVIPVEATTDPGDGPDPDLAIVFVKCTRTRSAMDAVSPVISPDTVMLTLQNGFRNPEIIAGYVPEDHVIAGVTEASSNLDGPGRITHTGTGATYIGNYFGPNIDFVDTVAAGFSAAGLSTTASTSIRDAIWKKVLVNLAYNPISGLTHEKVGAIIDSPAGQRVIRAVVTEAVAVARERGRSFDEDPVEYVLSVGEISRDHDPSMLQDIRAGRETEIEFLNGALVEFGEQHGVDVPVNRVLTELVRLAEP